MGCGVALTGGGVEEISQEQSTLGQGILAHSKVLTLYGLNCKIRVFSFSLWIISLRTKHGRKINNLCRYQTFYNKLSR